MKKENTEVFLLDKQDVPNIVYVLCNSFENYPVMRFVLNSGKNYFHQLNSLIHFFVMARIYREEIIIGVGNRTNLFGTALTSNPNKSINNAELNNLRESLWLELGLESKSRYQKFSDTAGQFKIDKPHIHLNMIGIRSEAQGKGLARKLMDRVHTLSKSDPNSSGVSLSTEDPEKVSFYQYMGYKIIGEAMVTDQLKTWSFFKPN